MQPIKQQYERPVEIADRVFWVGFHDAISNLHCNPYLVVEGDQAVLIDAGSRPDFAVVMMKILQTGVSPEKVMALIYQHPDPDLCGSMSNMVDICTNPELRILSESENNIFLSYYIEKEKRGLMQSVNEYDFQFALGGRILRFFKTPFAHSAGSFVTYDEQTKTLFTSDLFGSRSDQWDLFLRFNDDCSVCEDYGRCKEYCPFPDILEFHRKVMPSGKALRHAMNVIGGIDVERIAPQHGSILTRKRDIRLLIERLGNLTGVGIDGLA
jgi:flavorubredoxin